MTLPDPSDLLSLDRDVARAHAAWLKWTSALATDPEAHEGEAPLDRFRHVAGQSVYEALGRGVEGSADRPLRDGLRRWVYWLMQARIAQPVDIEIAKARSERSAGVRVPKPHLTSWQDAWRGVRTAVTAEEREGWLQAIVERAPAIASLAKRRAERREEADKRMGFVEDPLFPVTGVDLRASAEELLARTDDLARDVLARARRRFEMAEDPPLATDAIAVAIARDATEGWPSRLAWPWLDATFGHFVRGLRMPALSLPDAIGASSFARACASFGAALRLAGTSPSLRFAVAREPEDLAVHRFACVFGALPATAPFQRRVLGNVPRIADAQARILARTALLHARLEATAILLLRDSAPARFEQLTHTLFGAPLPARLAGTWPKPHGDERARFAGLVTAHALARDLVDRFDDDWFANPRAVQHVRAIASGPAREAEPPDLTAASVALARTFEEALG